MDESRLRRFVRRIGRSFVDVLIPSWCLSCQAPGSWLCASCHQMVELLPSGWCGSCGRRSPVAATLCRRCADPLGLTRLISALPYDGVVERVLRAVKYRPARIGLDELLSSPALSRLRAAVPASGWLVPIPLHRQHAEHRGFNQAELLAWMLAPQGQRARVTTHLERTGKRSAQVGLTRAQRRTNMADAFHWTGPALTGQTVCLVDDVLTTGATLAAAAQAVRQAGARRVVAITLAQTPPHRGVV